MSNPSRDSGYLGCEKGFHPPDAESYIVYGNLGPITAKTHTARSDAATNPKNIADFEE